MRQDLEKARGEIEDANRRLKALGCIVDAQAVVPKADIMASDRLRVWGHDLTVAVGHTYRYRFTIDVYNPFFGQKLALREEQQALGDPLILSSQASEWSEPVEIRPPLKFFIVGASPVGQGRALGKRNLGRVDVEVFRFYNGRWWMETFKPESGERIGGVRSPKKTDPLTVDFGTDWFVADIVPDPEGRSGPGGVGGHVMLQNLATGELRGYLDPVQEAADAEREELRQKVEAADNEQVAAKGP
jgi:hypothetical protein